MTKTVIVHAMKIKNATKKIMMEMMKMKSVKKTIVKKMVMIELVKKTVMKMTRKKMGGGDEDPRVLLLKYLHLQGRFKVLPNKFFFF